MKNLTSTAFDLGPIIATGLLVAAFSSYAADNWISAATATYNTPAAWSTGTPLTTDTAVVGNTTLLAGSVLYDDPTYNYAVTILQLGAANLANGTFTMSDGAFLIQNNASYGLQVGPTAGGTGNFVMSGGTLTVKRNSSNNWMYQDAFGLGTVAGATGNFTLNNGTVNCLGGLEIGAAGTGTLTVNGGTLMDNGWFGLARGGNPNGTGTFNLTGGTVYLLRNPGTDSGSSGLAFCQGGITGTANISGSGTLYVNTIRFAAAGSASHADTETLNVSGGDIYIGSGGIINGGGLGTKTINVNLSGGTFRTVNLGPNANGAEGLASVLPGGTDWTWTSAIPATLTGGTTKFAPEATRTITMASTFSGAGGLEAQGPGTVLMTANHTYTGNTTVSGGTLLVNGSLASGSAVNVTGGVLGGTGTIGGATTVGAATLAPGASPGTLSFGSDLSLASGTVLAYDLKGNDVTVGGGINDLATVAGTLTLDGTLNVTENGAGSFLTAVAGNQWRLFNYTVGLVNNGLDLGTTPALAGGLAFEIDTGTAGQVNLLVVTVPEPSVVALCLMGALFLGVNLRKRRGT